MMNRVRIRMLGGFTVFVNDRRCDGAIAKAKKGSLFLQYLILKHGAVVPSTRLMELLWAEENSVNPENALKTMVSRFRAQLEKCSPGLGRCIAASRGGYHFERLEQMSVDVYDFEALCDDLETAQDFTEEVDERFREALGLYIGDLLPHNGTDEWAIRSSASLHGRYSRLVYAYLALLKKSSRYEEIIQVCRVALESDPFDERLHLELMQALVCTNRNNEALMQYKHVASMHYRYLGMKPPEGIQEFYKQIVRVGDELEQNLSAIGAELRDYNGSDGAFECDFGVFREIYDIQIRNLERLGSAMYIAVVMISSVDGEIVDPLQMDDLARGLSEVLREHLRRGDTITHYSPSQYALLLPNVNMESGRVALERIKRFFYQRFPNSNMLLSYRIGPVSTARAEGPEDRASAQ